MRASRNTSYFSVYENGGGLSDAHTIVRAGVKLLLQQEEDWCVVGEASNGREAVALYEQQRPDVVLMDVRMPQMDGLEALKHILAKFPQARIVMLSAFDEQETIYQAIRAGAKAFLLKDVTPEELRHTVAQVAGGETYLTPHASTAIAHRLQHPELTVREQEVLEQLAAGKSNKEIAETLCIAEGTAKVHIANLIKKLGASDRMQAVTTAIGRGLIHLP